MNRDDQPHSRGSPNNETKAAPSDEATLRNQLMAAQYQYQQAMAARRNSDLSTSLAARRGSLDNAVAMFGGGGGSATNLYSEVPFDPNAYAIPRYDAANILPQHASSLQRQLHLQQQHYQQHEEVAASSASLLRDASQRSASSRYSVMAHGGAGANNNDFHHIGHHLMMEQALSSSASPTDQTRRFLEQRLREEAARASIAESAYLQAQEESRAIQQALTRQLQLQQQQQQQQQQSSMSSPNSNNHFVQQSPYNRSASSLLAQEESSTIQQALARQLQQLKQSNMPSPSSLAQPAYNNHHLVDDSTRQRYAHPRTMMTTTTDIGSQQFVPQHYQQQHQQPIQNSRYVADYATNVASHPLPFPQRVDDLRNRQVFSNPPPQQQQQQQQYPQQQPVHMSPDSILRILNAIGSTVRHGQKYVDVAQVPDLEAICASENSDVATAGVNKKTFAKTFPEKLHALLTMAETDNKLQSVVSFSPHGRAFVVHDIKMFCDETAPQHFQRLGQWKSFTRQLNLYGYTRIPHGPDAGAYYHELFLRGKPYLCHFMKRVGITQPGLDRRVKKNNKESQNDELMFPDLYAMPTVK